MYGGHKSDFQGHNKLSYRNVNVYPGVYGPRCVDLQALPLVGPNSRDNTGGDGNWDEAYSANKCILATNNETYITVGGKCTTSDKSKFSFMLGDNAL